MLKRVVLLVSLVLAVGIFFAAREAASWRPKMLMIGKSDRPQFQFSGDGRWLLIQNNSSLQTGVLWDWTNGRRQRELAAGTLRFSPDGNYLARFGVGQARIGARHQWMRATTVEIYQAESGRLVRSFADPEPRVFDAFQDANWSGDGAQLVITTIQGCATFRVSDGSVVSRWKREVAAARSAVSPDGALVLRVMQRNSEIREARSGRFVRGLSFRADSTRRVGFSPDSRWCYQVTQSGNLHHFWSLRDGKLVATTSGDSDQTPNFSATAGVLALSTPQGLELRRYPGNKLVKELGGPQSPRWTRTIFALAPDGKSAVSCDSKRRIWRWRLR